MQVLITYSVELCSEPHLCILCVPFDAFFSGMSPDQKVIAAIAATITWKQLASYLAIPLETAMPPSASIATQEDGVCAVLKKWAGTDPQIPWQKLELVLDKAGRSDISHEIRQCTTPAGTCASSHLLALSSGLNYVMIVCTQDLHQKTQVHLALPVL